MMTEGLSDGSLNIMLYKAVFELQRETEKPELRIFVETTLWELESNEEDYGRGRAWSSSEVRNLLPKNPALERVF
jgi:hypothetical protein